MRIGIGAAMLVAGLALAGCGKAPGNATASETTTTTTTTTKQVAKVDVCTLLTADEVQAITGDKLRGTQRSDADGCNYKTSDDESLQVQVDLADAKHEMAIFHQAGELLGGIGSAVANTSDVGADVNNALKKNGAAVPAIGDEAAWGANDALAVRKGDLFVQVSPPVAHDPATHKGFPLIPDAEKRTIAQATVEKLLAKLAK